MLLEVLSCIGLILIIGVVIIIAACALSGHVDDQTYGRDREG